MPSLGADMEAGALIEWLIKPGDKVKRGDVVAVVETQKGAIEIEIFETGQVEDVLVDLNAKVPVGTPLARIRSEAPPGAAAPPAAPRGAPGPPAGRGTRPRRGARSTDATARGAHPRSPPRCGPRASLARGTAACRAAWGGPLPP